MVLPVDILGLGSHFSSMPGKSQLVLFDQSDNAGATDVKVDGSVLKMLELTFSSKLDWGSYIISVT